MSKKILALFMAFAFMLITIVSSYADEIVPSDAISVNSFELAEGEKLSLEFVCCIGDERTRGIGVINEMTITTVNNNVFRAHYYNYCLSSHNPSITFTVAQYGDPGIVSGPHTSWLPIAAGRTGIRMYTEVRRDFTYHDWRRVSFIVSSTCTGTGATAVSPFVTVRRS